MIEYFQSQNYIVLLLQFFNKMNRSPLNYRTLSNYSHYSATKSFTQHKIPHNNLTDYKFQDLIYDRMNSVSTQAKSIFFLKVNIKKEDMRYKRQNKQKLPRLSISSTLDSPQGNRKSKNQTYQQNKTLYKINQIKSVQMYLNDSKLCEQNRKRTNIRGKLQKKQKQKQIKKQIQLHDIVLGNKTIMNFRPRQEPNRIMHQRKKQNNVRIDHMKKIKFGSFYHSVNLHQICPW